MAGPSAVILTAKRLFFNAAEAAAEAIGCRVPVVGAAMGLVAISNIVAVSSILGLDNQDGFVLKRTVIPLIVYALIAGISV